MRWTGLFLIIFFFSEILFAQGVTDFINLGFSPDARYFMYGEYGLINNSPYAGISIVNTAENRFVAQTPIVQTFSVTPSTGETGMGALLTLLHEHTALVKEYGIDFLSKGRPIYLSVNGNSQLEFRDFVTDTSYEISLRQQSRIRAQITESQFSIEGKIHNAEKQTTAFIAGTPQLFRENVVSYEIRKIILGPDSHPLLVFFVQKNEEINGLPRVRYMVETAVIP